MMRNGLWQSRISAGLLLCGALAILAGPTRAATGAIAISAERVRAASDEELTVSFDAHFDNEGRLVKLQAHDEAEQPAAFWAGLQSRLSAMKVPPVRDASGQAVSFRTGLYVRVQVKRSDGGGEVSIADVKPGPLVLTRAYAGYPNDIAAAAGWSGDVTADCIVAPQGQCGEVRVEVLPGMPDSVVRWARATLGLWRFRPPEVNGQAVSVPVKQSFHLQTADDMPIDFRQRGAGGGAWMRR